VQPTGGGARTAVAVDLPALSIAVVALAVAHVIRRRHDSPRPNRAIGDNTARSKWRTLRSSAPRRALQHSLCGRFKCSWQAQATPWPGTAPGQQQAARMSGSSAASSDAFRDGEHLATPGMVDGQHAVSVCANAA